MPTDIVTINSSPIISVHYYREIASCLHSPTSCFLVILPSFLYPFSSSTPRLRPLCLFLPPLNYLLISFVVFLYFFFLQVCDLKFFGQSVVIHYLYMFFQFILYCVNLSLILACLTTDHGVAGSIPGTSTNFKCGLGLERGPPSLVRTIG